MTSRKRPRVLLVVAAVATVSIHGQELPVELQWSVTVRDFLPSFCMRADEYPVYVESAPADDRAWVDLMSDQGCPGGAFEGLGHPDFEMRWGAFGVTGYGWNLSTPITSNSAGNAPVSSIIDRDAGTRLASSGLRKPRYCTSEPAGRCGFALDGRGNPMWITAGQTSFEEWWNDAPRNRRLGVRLRIPALSGSPGVYQFDSNRHADGFFGPLDFALPADGEAAAAAGVFPATNFERGLGHKFSFTTEVQSWFEYRGDGSEEFSFSGDDDVFVFIDGRLAVDLGGVHSRATTTVPLHGALAERFNLTVGRIYEFSLFQAERRTSESNFMLTTSLRPSCNVQFSGAVAADSRQRSLGSGAWFASTRPGYVLEDTKTLVLTKPEDVYASRRVFFTQQHNVGSGFVAEFTLDVATAAGAANNGFAFVLTRRPEGLRNWPSSTGVYHGFRYVSHSLAVVFDGTQGQVRLHYQNESAAFNDATDPRTLRVHDTLRMRANGSHVVRIQYLSRPDWLEVFVDDSLYLRQRDLDLESVLGGRSAFAGFTAGTSAAPAYQAVRDYTLRAVSIDEAATRFAAAQTALDAPADGRAAASVVLENFDRCGDRIAFGGFGGDAQGVFVQVSAGTERRRSLLRRALQTDEDLAVVPAQVEDRGDGSYALQLVTDRVAAFELYAAFGRNCSLEVVTEGDGSMPRVALAPGAPASCWFQRFPDAVRMAEPEAMPLPPTASPLPGPGGPDDDRRAVYSRTGAVGGGVLAALLGIAALLYVCFKRRWDKDKAFVPEGEEYLKQKRLNVRRGSGMDVDSDDPSVVAARLQLTREAVMRERAARGTRQRDAEFQSLVQEQEQLRAHIRETKQQRERRLEDRSRNGLAMPAAVGRRAARRKQFRGSEAEPPPPSQREAQLADALARGDLQPDGSGHVPQPQRRRRSSSTASVSSALAGAAALTRQLTRRVSTTLQSGLGKPVPSTAAEPADADPVSGGAPPPPPLEDHPKRWSWLRLFNEADLVPDDVLVPPPPLERVDEEDAVSSDDDEEERRRQSTRTSSRGDSISEHDDELRDHRRPASAPPGSPRGHGRMSLRSALAANSRRSHASRILMRALPPLRPPPGLERGNSELTVRWADDEEVVGSPRRPASSRRYAQEALRKSQLQKARQQQQPGDDTS